MQIDVIRNHHQRALFVFEINATGRVCQDESAYPHPAKHAGWERDLFCGIAFVQMHPPLHRRYRDVANLSHHHLTRMTYRCGAGKRGNVGIRDSRSFREVVGKSAETRA